MAGKEVGVRIRQKQTAPFIYINTNALGCAPRQDVVEVGAVFDLCGGQVNVQTVLNPGEVVIKAKFGQIIDPEWC